MFSATITGQIQRVIYDNGKDGADAMLKVVLAVPKQYAKKDDDNTHIFPLITIFGHNANYLRQYAGKGQIISCINCELDLYKNEKFEDDKGNNPDTASFTTRTVMFPKRAIMEALVEAGVAEEAEGGDEEDTPKRGKKKGGKRSERRSSGRSRGRSRDDDDDDDEEEEEKPRRKKPASKSNTKKSSSKKPVDDDDYDDDYDDDDDDYFDEDED